MLPGRPGPTGTGEPDRTGEPVTGGTGTGLAELSWGQGRLREKIDFFISQFE